MNTMQTVLNKIKKTNLSKKIGLSLLNDMEIADAILREEIIGQASDSFPVYATNTVFYLLQENYNEIRERVKGILSEYDYEESYNIATKLEGFAQSEINNAKALLKEYKSLADQIGIDLNNPEVLNSSYGGLIDSIDWAEESIAYMTGLDWKGAYEDIKKLETT